MNIAYFADAQCIHGQKWITHFAKHGNVILLTTDSQNHFPLFEKFTNVSIFPVLPASFPALKVFQRQRVIRQIKSLLCEYQIDIVHAMYAVPYAFWASQSWTGSYIVTTRGSDVLIDYQTFCSPEGLRQRLSYGVLKRLFERALIQADYITSTSLRQLEVISSFHPYPENLLLTRTGVDVENFLIGLGREERSTDEIIIFSNRRPTALYNIHVIIDAFKLLKETWMGKPLRLVTINYCANKQYLTQIKKQIKEMGLQKSVDVLDTQDEAGLLRCYRNASVAVMIPESDGTPVSGIESMLARCPLIVGNVLYDNDLFNEQTVWSIDTNTAEKLASVLSEVLILPEEEKAKKLDAAFAAAINGASLQKSLTKTNELYRKLLGESGMTTPYNVCKQCILDTNDDPDIRFDSQGICHYCENFNRKASQFFSSHSNKSNEKLEKIIATIKSEGEGKPYDCVVGVSGGVDSTYVAWLAKQFGLHPLVVHYDNGWNSELAVKNIENIVSRLGFDLYTHVNDWEEFRSLQLSFFRASVLDIELLTDQAIGALLIQIARRYGIKYVLSGSNFVTEGTLPENWYHRKDDVLNIRAIHGRFSETKLRTYPMLGFWQRWNAVRGNGIKSIHLLDYISYNKAKAKEVITNELGWRDYGGKHHESIFTRFFQSYYLPEKFGIDKRKAHLSTLICSGQITRDEAILEMGKPICEAQILESDKAYVIKKLGVSNEEFERIMKLPTKMHTDYPSYLTRHYRYQAMFSTLLQPIKRLLGKEGAVVSSRELIPVDNDTRESGGDLY